MAAEPERVAVACTTEQTQLGEGVRWDARRDELLRVDILAGRVYRDQVRSDGTLVPVRVYQLPWPVGMIAPVEDDEGCFWALAVASSIWPPTAPTGPSPRSHRPQPG